MPSFVRSAALFTFLALIPACGRGDEVVEEQKVHTKQESTTLAAEGTAKDEAAMKQRQADTEEKLRQNAAKKKLSVLRIQLEEAQKTGDGFDIAEVIAKIAELGDMAAPFEPQLEPFLKHEDEDVRISALKTLVAIRQGKARPTLQAAFEDENDAVRAAALRLWRKAEIKETAPVLAMLDDYDSNVQYEAVAALQAADPDVVVLEKITQKVNDFQGPTARLALTIGIENKDRLGAAVVDALVIELLDHQDRRTRIDAMDQAHANKMLRKGVAEKMISILRNDPEEDVRKRAHEIMLIWAGAGAPAYDPTADEASRREAAEAWRAWLAANASKFGG
ncbi:MAG: HEAT repeat domain-containing protein [Planctomycetes bacterium]|nr:HEAT repeat domain-containing protein [Planctomycetota bacterium]